MKKAIQAVRRFFFTRLRLRRYGLPDTLFEDMEDNQPIPADMQRFILAVIESVPHLETALLLRKDPKAEWDAKTVIGRLYLGEKKAALILEDLRDSGLVVVSPETGRYHYEPIYLGLREKMDQLADLYNKNLKEVTNLIHSKISKQAQELGDAFKWQE